MKTKRSELAASLKGSLKKKKKHSESNFYLLFRPDDDGPDSERSGALLSDMGLCVCENFRWLLFGSKIVTEKQKAEVFSKLLHLPSPAVGVSLLLRTPSFSEQFPKCSAGRQSPRCGAMRGLRGQVWEIYTIFFSRESQCPPTYQRSWASSRKELG